MNGDRPAEETWNGRPSPECTPRCGTRGTSRIVHDHATPPAVRPGDDDMTYSQLADMNLTYDQIKKLMSGDPNEPISPDCS